MVLAVAVLHQAIFGNRVVAIGSRSIQANGGGNNLVDFAGSFPKIFLQGRPVSLSQTSQDDTQTIIRKFHCTERLSAEGLECMLMRLSPIANADLTVIGLGEDKGHPGASEPAIGQSFMEVMAAEMTLHQLWQVQLLHQTNQQGNVVYTLVLK